MVSGLSWVESFSSLDRNFLQLSDLSDEFLFSRLFSNQFILHSLRCLLHLFTDLVSNLSILSFFCSLSLCDLDGLTLNLLHDFFSLLKFFLICGLSFFKLFVHLFLNFRGKCMVLFYLSLLCLDSMFTAELHFNFLFNYVLGPFDVIFLFHLALPSDELTSILKTHLHLRKFLGGLAFLHVYKMLLSF